MLPFDWCEKWTVIFKTNTFSSQGEQLLTICPWQLGKNWINTTAQAEHGEKIETYCNETLVGKSKSNND